jgi:small subunit ribosomal protein S15
MTKTKKLRLLKKATSGSKPKRLPPNYIPVTKPVLIAPTAQRESIAQVPEDSRLSNLLPIRSEKLAEDLPPLRFNFTNLAAEMSPKVRQLFDLTNGSTMEVAKAQRSRAMELFEMRPGDTGSSAVQIMALTSRIQQMQKHIGMHKKDHSGKRGLDAMYVRRRKLLDYLERTDFDTYSVVVKALGLVK